MNSWSDYVIEGRRAGFTVYKGVVMHYGDFVVAFGGKAGGLDNLRIGSGFLMESNRENCIKLKRLVTNETFYLDFDEIEFIKVDVKDVSKLTHKDQPVIAACDNQIGVYSAGVFSRKGDMVMAEHEIGPLIGKILTIGTKGIKIEGHGTVEFNKTRKIVLLKFSTQPKLAKDCTPTELREIADLKEHIEYQKVKIAKLEEDAKVASFKINHLAAEGRAYELAIGRNKRIVELKDAVIQQLSEEAEYNRNLIKSMPKVIVNHYKNKLAKQGY